MGYIKTTVKTIEITAYTGCPRVSYTIWNLYQLHNIWLKLVNCVLNIQVKYFFFPTESWKEKRVFP